jgi:hypothetical protein
MGAAWARHGMCELAFTLHVRCMCCLHNCGRNPFCVDSPVILQSRRYSISRYECTWIHSHRDFYRLGVGTDVRRDMQRIPPGCTHRHLVWATNVLLWRLLHSIQLCENISTETRKDQPGSVDAGQTRLFPIWLLPGELHFDLLILRERTYAKKIQ